MVSFDSVDHEWLLRIAAHRIADRRVLRLIRQWLKAGVLESGEWRETTEGTPQGAGVSPLLAKSFCITRWSCGRISGGGAGRGVE